LTLNTTLFETNAFHQASDFRLVDPRDGSLRTDSSPKQVFLNYYGWAAVVTYAGIGQVGTLTTADRLVKMFVDAGGGTRFDEAMELIRADAEGWLQQVPRSHRHHTFSVAGLESGRPVLVVISNFEDISGLRNSLPGTFSISSADDPVSEAFFTGQGAVWVPAEGRAMLQRIARRRSSRPRAVRACLARVNARAAAVDSSVSAGCSCVTLQADGQAWGEHWGTPTKGWFPRLVDNGRDLSSQLQAVSLDRAQESSRLTAALHLGIPLTTVQIALRAGQPDVTMTLAEIGPVRPPPDDLVAAIEAKRRRNDPCWCGSGSKFKKCHGR
jgi:SEC-C motif